MATQAELNQAQLLYVAYYGRPADPAGLEFWAEQIAQVGVAGIAADFGNSAEFEAEFGDLGSVALINNLYQQLFGRDAETEGLQYWLDVLAEGTPLASIALEIANGAQGGDATGLQNKVTLANQFTALVASGDVSYDGADAAAYGRAFLATINENTNVEAYDVQAVVDGIASGVLPVDTADLRQGLEDLRDAEAALETFLEDARDNELLQENQAITEASTTAAVSTAIVNESAAANGLMVTATGDANFATRAASTQDTLIADRLTVLEEAVSDFEARIANVDGLAEALADLNAANEALEEAQETAATAANLAEAEISSFVIRANNYGTVTEVDDGAGNVTGYTAVNATNAAVETLLTVNANGQLVIAAGFEQVAGITALRDALQADLNARAAEVSAQADADAALVTLGEVEAQDDFAAEFDGTNGEVVYANADAVNTQLETLETAVSDFQDLTVRFENARDLETERAELVETRDAALDNIEELGFDLQDIAAGALAADEGNDVFLFADSAGPGNEVTIAGFGEEGVDRIFFGPEYKLVQLAEGETIESRVGSSSDLEIFWSQGDTGLELFVESAVTSGNATNVAEITTITLTGVNAEDISFTSGFLAAGTVTEVA